MVGGKAHSHAVRGPATKQGRPAHSRQHAGACHAPAPHQVQRQQHHLVLGHVLAAPRLHRLQAWGASRDGMGSEGSVARAGSRAPDTGGLAQAMQSLAGLIRVASTPFQQQRACSLSTLREERMRRAPPAAQCRASASPSPWLAPTIHTTLPCHAPGGGAGRDSRVRSASALWLGRGGGLGEQVSLPTLEGAADNHRTLLASYRTKRSSVHVAQAATAAAPASRSMAGSATAAAAAVEASVPAAEPAAIVSRLPLMTVGL